MFLLKKSLDRAGKSSSIIRTSADVSLQENESVEDDDYSTGGTRQVDREKEIYSRFLRGEEISDDEYDENFTTSLKTKIHL